MSEFVTFDIEQQLIQQPECDTTDITPLFPVDGMYISNRNAVADERALRTSLIAKNPKICNGEPIIQGSRISVSNIVELSYLLGWDIQKIQDEYPYLTGDQIMAALEYYEFNTQEIDSCLKEEKEVNEA